MGIKLRRSSDRIEFDDSVANLDTNLAQTAIEKLDQRTDAAEITITQIDTRVGELEVFKRTVIATPTTFYVDRVNGDNSNDGSQASPWRTIKYGAEEIINKYIVTSSVTLEVLGDYQLSFLDEELDFNNAQGGGSFRLAFNGNVNSSSNANITVFYSNSYDTLVIGSKTYGNTITFDSVSLAFFESRSEININDITFDNASFLAINALYLHFTTNVAFKNYVSIEGAEYLNITNSALQADNKSSYLPGFYGEAKFKNIKNLSIRSFVLESPGKLIFENCLNISIKPSYNVTLQDRGWILIKDSLSSSAIDSEYFLFDNCNQATIDADILIQDNLNQRVWRNKNSNVIFKGKLVNDSGNATVNFAAFDNPDTFWSDYLFVTEDTARFVWEVPEAGLTKFITGGNNHYVESYCFSDIRFFPDEQLPGLGDDKFEPQAIINGSNYDNSNTNLNANNLEAAVDELATRDRPFTQRFTGLLPQINADTTKWQVGIGAGQLADSYTDPRLSVIRNIENTAVQIYDIPTELDGTTTAVYAYYYWNSTAISVGYQATAPVADDLVDKLFLCALLSSDGVTIDEVRPISLADEPETKTLLNYGGVNVTSVFPVPIAITMRLSVGSQTLKLAGRNAYTNPKKPHTLEFSSVAEISYLLCQPDGSVINSTPQTDFNFNQIWNGSAATPLQSVSNFSVQFLFRYPNGVFLSVLGKHEYTSLDFAASFSMEMERLPYALKNNAIYLCAIAGRGDATDLSDDDPSSGQALIIPNHWNSY